MKNEIRREALDVAIDLLIETCGRHAIDRSQVGVQQYALATDGTMLAGVLMAVDPASDIAVAELENCV
jgi:hypothetical protein